MSAITLNERQQSKIMNFLRSCRGIYVGNEEKTLRFIAAILWIVRSGSQWELLPASYGKWNSVYKRFARWCKRDIFTQMHAHFAVDPDLECLLLDSTIIRAHPCAAGAPASSAIEAQPTQALGRSRGGYSTKIHIVVDALGNPLRLLLTGGHRSDATQALALLEGFDFEALLADRGYDSDKILAFVAQNDAQAVIRGALWAKKNHLVQRDTDWHTYKVRHLVECFMNKIKHYRRIFLRFEKYASRYMAFLSFASALIWLR